jgi:hypothetical protein
MTPDELPGFGGRHQPRCETEHPHEQRLDLERHLLAAPMRGLGGDCEPAAGFS